MTIHLKKTPMLLAVVALCALPQIAGRLNASPVQSTRQNTDNYAWPAELVALDQSSRTMTVKTRVMGDEAPVELGHFKTGERIALTWSGVEKSAWAVSHGVRWDATKNSDALFTFPVEFVSFDAANNFVTFKVSIPAGGLDALKSLKPGEWVRAISPHRVSSETEVIADVKPYVAAPTTSWLNSR